MAVPPGTAALQEARRYVELERDGTAYLRDVSGLRRDGIDTLVRAAVFATDEPTRAAGRHLVWAAAHADGAVSASIHGLYAARGKKRVRGFTVPAMNLRGMTYDVARAAFRAAASLEVGALIFEIAKSEMQYTQQPPAEYATSVLAAAVKEAWRRPVFLQGDHFQFNAKNHATDAPRETEGIRALIREALGAGFHNIDIDASTLVDLSKKAVPEQQAVNAELTAQMTGLIRTLEPPGLTISVGGEIGEVGKKNSTEEELRVYLASLRARLDAQKKETVGVSKVSIQTGTHHGGLVGPDGKVIEVDVDFDVLERLSAVAVEEFGLAGCVQHGASTLPDGLFHKFPEAGTAEIHLATGFQNALLDHADFPADLKRRIYAHLEKAHAEERKPNETLEQFHYKTRKKCFGPFKRELWDLVPDARRRILRTLEERFAFLYRELRVPGTQAAVAAHVKPVVVARAAPLGLL